MISKKTLYRLMAAVMTVSVLFVCNACVHVPAGSSDGNTHVSVMKEGEMTERQKEILTHAGLPADYDKLTDSQKSAITSIEDMLTWLEDKYQQEFCYVSYVPGGTLEKEHLEAYPAESSEADTVTVYRTYEDGSYQYEDNFGEVLIRPVYEEWVSVFVQQYLPVEGVKIYTEIKTIDEKLDKIISENVLEKGDAGAPLEEDAAEVVTEMLPGRVSAVTYLYMDSAVCGSQYDKFLDAVPGWLSENCRGVPAGLWLRMADTAEWQEIDRSNYEDKIREDIYTEKADCAISGSGKVTVN